MNLMDENLQKAIDLNKLDEFDEKFNHAVEDGYVFVEFSLQEIKDAVLLRAKIEELNEESTEEALNHCIESYMRDLDEIKEKIDASIKDNTLTTNEKIGVDRYSYYYKRTAEIEGLSEQEAETIAHHKRVDFGREASQGKDADSPFDEELNKSDDDLEI